MEKSKVIASMEELFLTYDKNYQGWLSEEDLRIFLNDIRIAMGQDALDDDLFVSIKHTIDRNKTPHSLLPEKKDLFTESLLKLASDPTPINKRRENEETTPRQDDAQTPINIGKKESKWEYRYEPIDLISHLEDILQKVITISKATKKKIKSTFFDFDIDSSGAIQKNEMKLLCHLECDRLGVVRSDDWQVEYLISVIDDDGNGDIDLDEFYTHYREINEILMTNRVVKNNVRSKRIEFLTNSNHCGWSIEVRQDFINGLSKLVRSFELNKKDEDAISEKSCEGKAQNSVTDSETEHEYKNQINENVVEVVNRNCKIKVIEKSISHVNRYATNQAKEILPLSGLLNLENYREQKKTSTQKPEDPDYIIPKEETKNMPIPKCVLNLMKKTSDFLSDKTKIDKIKAELKKKKHQKKEHTEIKIQLYDEEKQNAENENNSCDNKFKDKIHVNFNENQDLKSLKRIESLQSSKFRINNQTSEVSHLKKKDLIPRHSSFNEEVFANREINNDQKKSTYVRKSSDSTQMFQSCLYENKLSYDIKDSSVKDLVKKNLNKYLFEMVNHIPNSFKVCFAETLPLDIQLENCKKSFECFSNFANEYSFTDFEQIVKNVGQVKDSLESYIEKLFQFLFLSKNYLEQKLVNAEQEKKEEETEKNNIDLEKYSKLFKNEFENLTQPNFNDVAKSSNAFKHFANKTFQSKSAFENWTKRYFSNNQVLPTLKDENPVLNTQINASTKKNHLQGKIYRQNFNNKYLNTSDSQNLNNSMRNVDAVYLPQQYKSKPTMENNRSPDKKNTIKQSGFHKKSTEALNIWKSSDMKDHQIQPSYNDKSVTTQNKNHKPDKSKDGFLNNTIK